MPELTKKPKKIGDNNHALSIAVPKDKFEQFKLIVKTHDISMGKLLNQFINRVIEANSINVYGNSIGNNELTIETMGRLDKETIEELISSFIGVIINPMEESFKISIGEIEQAILKLDEELSNMKKFQSSKAINLPVVAKDKNDDQDQEQKFTMEKLDSSSIGIVSAELARRIGGSKANVSKWANGTSNPSEKYQKVMENWEYIKEDGLWYLK